MFFVWFFSCSRLGGGGAGRELNWKWIDWVLEEGNPEFFEIEFDLIVSFLRRNWINSFNFVEMDLWVEYFIILWSKNGSIHGKILWKFVEFLGSFSADFVDFLGDFQSNLCRFFVNLSHIFGGKFGKNFWSNFHELMVNFWWIFVEFWQIFNGIWADVKSIYLKFLMVYLVNWWIFGQILLNIWSVFQRILLNFGKFSSRFVSNCWW